MAFLEELLTPQAAYLGKRARLAGEEFAELDRLEAALAEDAKRLAEERKKALLEYLAKRGLATGTTLAKGAGEIESAIAADVLATRMDIEQQRAAARRQQKELQAMQQFVRTQEILGAVKGTVGMGLAAGSLFVPGMAGKAMGLGATMLTGIPGFASAAGQSAADEETRRAATPSPEAMSFAPYGGFGPTGQPVEPWQVRSFADSDYLTPDKWAALSGETLYRRNPWEIRQSYYEGRW